MEDPGGDGESESQRKRSGDGLEVGREEVRTDSINALFISSW